MTWRTGRAVRPAVTSRVGVTSRAAESDAGEIDDGSLEQMTVKTTEERDAIRETNVRRKHCGKCGGACTLLAGLDDEAHFPSVVYKRCIACGWEIPTKRRPR